MRSSEATGTAGWLWAAAVYALYYGQLLATPFVRAKLARLAGGS